MRETRPEIGTDIASLISRIKPQIAAAIKERLGQVMLGKGKATEISFENFLKGEWLAKQLGGKPDAVTDITKIRDKAAATAAALWGKKEDIRITLIETTDAVIRNVFDLLPNPTPPEIALTDSIYKSQVRMAEGRFDAVQATWEASLDSYRFCLSGVDDERDENKLTAIVLAGAVMGFYHQKEIRARVETACEVLNDIAAQRSAAQSLRGAASAAPSSQLTTGADAVLARIENLSRRIDAARAVSAPEESRASEQPRATKASSPQAQSLLQPPLTTRGQATPSLAARHERSGQSPRGAAHLRASQPSTLTSHRATSPAAGSPVRLLRARVGLSPTSAAPQTRVMFPEPPPRIVLTPPPEAGDSDEQIYAPPAPTASPRGTTGLRTAALSRRGVVPAGGRGSSRT